MENFVDTLKGLKLEGDTFVTMTYGTSADVWHISETHVEDAVAATDTADMLGALLATRGLAVYNRYGEDMLNEMRTEGLLENYEYDSTFEEYLSDTLRASVYDYAFVDTTTERYDYKRGRCDVSATIKVRVGDVYGLNSTMADSIFNSWTATIETPKGTLTLSP